MNQQPYAIVLLGNPGSGKKTQAERLKGYTHLEMSTILKEKNEKNPVFAYQCNQEKHDIHSGRLFSDRLVMWAFSDVFFQLSELPNLVLDGVPRTVSQLEGVTHILETKGYKISFLWLQCCFAASLNRMENRVLPNGTRRPDDANAEERLRKFAEGTREIVNHLAFLKRTVVCINADLAPDEVENQICEVVSHSYSNISAISQVA